MLNSETLKWLKHSMEHGKRTPDTSTLHTTPNIEYSRTFPQENIIHVIQTYPCFTTWLPFLYLYYLSEQILWSRFVPTHLPLKKANFCLVSRSIFSNLYESAFSALLIHSSVIPFLFPIRVLTSKKDFKNTFNPFFKEWLTEKERIKSSNYSCQSFYLLLSILIFFSLIAAFSFLL